MVRIFPINRWLEPLFALAVLIGLAYAVHHLLTFGYLPQPYFYEPNDLWADWFNSAYWAYDKGTYDSWGSIYPPLSFVMLRILSLPHCYPISAGDTSAGYMARDCDWVGITALHGFFVLNIILIAWTFWRWDRRTALPRSIALSAGLPMTYALERGNLILACFACVLIAYGPLCKWARVRWIAAGLAINFKVYLVSALAAQLLRRRWRWFEGALIATLVIYVLTYIALGRGTPVEIYDNVASFSGLYQAVNLLDIWYAGTYTPMLSLLSGAAFPIDSLIGSFWAQFLTALITNLLHATQLTIVAAAAAAWLRPEVVPPYRLTNLAVSLALITAESGGYTQSIILFFAFLETWRGIGRKWAIIASYILCLPADIVFSRVQPVIRQSYWSGGPVFIEYAVTLGPFLRPLLIMSIPFALACVTLRAVWLDVRHQGWRTRWRFRGDAPLLPGIERPKASE